MCEHPVFCVNKLRIRSNTTAAYWKNIFFSISYMFRPKLSIISLCIKIYIFLYKHRYVPLGPKHSTYWKHCTIFQQIVVMFGGVLNSSAFIYSRHKKNVTTTVLHNEHNKLIWLFCLFVLQTVHWLIWHSLWHWCFSNQHTAQYGLYSSTATITVSVIAFYYS
jgi:hypothetical protein